MALSNPRDVPPLRRRAPGSHTAIARWAKWRTHLLATALWACCTALVASPAIAADDAAALERTVKAAFVYKFLSYVEWPAGAFARPDAPIVIGVYGADDIGSELSQVVPGRTIADRPLEVRRVKEADPLTGLHVLFIGRAESNRIRELAQVARQNSILVISESDNALDSGSIINLVLADGRVRFEVALDAAEKSGLKLSSRMLALARVVRTGGS